MFFRENETLLLADKKHRDPLYERDDLKITLKLFVKDFNYNSVCDAISSTMNELKIDRIEQLIIAFPQPGKFFIFKILLLKNERSFFLIILFF